MINTCSTMQRMGRARSLAEKIALVYFNGSDCIPGTLTAAPLRSIFADLLEIKDNRIILQTMAKPEPGTFFFCQGIFFW